MAKVRVLSLIDVAIQVTEGDRPELQVHVTGTVTSSGWKNPELRPLEKTLSADGILDIAFVAEPPAGKVLMVITPVTAQVTWLDSIERLVGVKVYSRTNEIVRLLPGPDMTTMAVGEEGAVQAAGMPMPTMAIGEGPFPTTMALGEEGPTTWWPGGESPPTWPFPGEGPKIPIGETGPAFDDPKMAWPEGPGMPFPWISGFRNPFGSR